MKNILLFILLVILCSNANAWDVRGNYGEHREHRDRRYYPEYVVPVGVDGFIDCITYGNGSGGTCRVYSGYSVVMEGTYFQILQQVRPGSIYRGYALEQTNRNDRLIVHIYFSYQH